MTEENRAQGGQMLSTAHKVDQNSGDTPISITRDITCLYCGKKGLMGIHNEDEGDTDGRLFRYLGHNPFSADMHYQCPACGIVLLVDPMLALGEKPIEGRPYLLKDKKTSRGEGVFQGFMSGLIARAFLGDSEKLH
jgi:hypothetical protein